MRSTAWVSTAPAPSRSSSAARSETVYDGENFGAAKKFLTRLDKEVPAELDVHLIGDNYGTHKAPVVAKWLAAHPRFHMLFTPTYSSWLNQVERWFGLLTDQQLRRGVHKSVAALEKSIRDWVAAWNNDPKPFVWTKNADEILERLAAYLQRIPGAVH